MVFGGIGMRKELGLYRQAFALFINEAVQRRQIMNLSAGAGSFKMLRGVAPYIQYDAVSDRLMWDRLGEGAGVEEAMMMK
jgi:hypothetical protein